MCNATGIIFGATALAPRDVEGKRVIEVGAYDVNGSLRPVLMRWKPAEYIGVDIVAGPGVDVICPAEALRDRFSEASFDVVLSTEMLEHVLDWRQTVNNLKSLCKPGGLLLITTRSIGIAYHGFPYDFWRFQLSDFEEIFSDFTIENLEEDKLAPGVFLKARRPDDYQAKDLTDLAVFSIITKSRVRNVPPNQIRRFNFMYRLRLPVIKVGEKIASVFTP